MSVKESLARATILLAASGVETPRLDAQLLLAWVLGARREDLARAPERPLSDRERLVFDKSVALRALRRPLPYITGTQWFYGRPFKINRAVLIPRPETEQLVDHALVEIDRRSADRPRRPMETNSVAVDLGTGSGAIGLALVAERPGVAVWGVERSADALAVARANAAGAGRAAARVRLVEGWWFDPLPYELRGAVDVIVANPPYVAADASLPDEVARWEPVDALVPGPSGLEAIQVILAGASAWVAPGGSVLIEIGETQGAAVSALAGRAAFSDVEVRRDLLGRDRFLVARS